MTSDELKEAVWAELVACYGGEDADWPFLTDLCDVVVSLIEVLRAAGRLQ